MQTESHRVHVGSLRYINPSQTTSSSSVASSATFHAMHFSKATLITLIYAVCISAVAVPAPANEGSAVDHLLEARQICIDVNRSMCSIQFFYD